MSKVKPLSYLAVIEPYLPGDFAVEGVEEIVKLSSNESPLGPSPKAIEALATLQPSLQTYPDSFATELRKTIAEKYSLDPEQIACEAGSEPIINLLARAYAQIGDEILFSQYGFIAYKIAALSMGATPVAAPEIAYTASVDSLLDCVSERTRILFLANPNNPTGTGLPFTEIKRLRESLREDILLVLDAAYAEYCHADEYRDGSSLVNNAAANVVVLHTFSKIYGLAALRVGWAYAPLEIVEVLNNLRGVFTVSTAAQLCAVAALHDEAHLQKSRTHNNAARASLSAQLAALGFNVLPSATNFVCVQFTDSAAAAAADLLLRQYGLIPRTLNEYDMPDCLRITVGLTRHCDKVVQLLASTR